MSRMSDDLISRKTLLGTERLLMTDIVQNNPTAKYILEQVLYDIEHTETAFDKEKVIEELEDYLFEKYCVEGDEKIAEIVEKGGIG